MRVVWGLALLLFLLALPVALLTSNVRWLAKNLSFYQWGYQRNFSYEATGLPREELDRATGEMITYFNSGEGFPQIQVQAGGKIFPLFNQRDILHLRDVRDLVQITYRLQEVSLAYLLFFSLSALWRRNGVPLIRLALPLEGLVWPWMLGGIFTAGLLLVMGLSMLLDFDRLFLQFHLVSFSNEFWMLDPATSYLIRMVPQGFFLDLAVGVVGLALAQSAVLAALAGAFLAWQKRGAP